MRDHAPLSRTGDASPYDRGVFEEIRIRPARDGLPPSWDQAKANLDKIGFDDLGPLRREFSQLINFELLTYADYESGARDELYLQEARRVLAEDLAIAEQLFAAPSAAGDLTSSDSTITAAVEQHDAIFTVRGIANPKSADDYLTPYWVLMRLLISGALGFAGYDSQPEVEL